MAIDGNELAEVLDRIPRRPKRNSDGSDCGCGDTELVICDVFARRIATALRQAAEARERTAQPA